MGYLHIENLYRYPAISLFREVYALEKIHGTSSHLFWNDGQLGYFAGGEKYANFIQVFNHDALVEKFKEYANLDKVIVYGEAYGGKQQGQKWRYGNELKFVAFDVKIGDHWLDVPSAERFVLNLGLEFVHYRKIPANIESLDAERDAPSEQAKRNSMGDDKPREGVVLRPLVEMRTSAEKRVIAKHKRADEQEINKKHTKPLSDEEQSAQDAARAIAEVWATPIRLDHVLDKMKVNGEEVPINMMGDLIRNMVEDITREGEGEVEVTKKVRKAIGNVTIKLFKKRLALFNAGREELWEGTITK
jgi:hypothetical protein